MAAPSTACPAQPPSVLDALGDELTSVLTPVSVCMMLTVVLVKLLSPHGSEGAASDAVAIATLYYDETEGDPVGQKFFGSMVNALLFVLVVGALTFVLVLLFKYGCARCIWVYMGFAGLQIFAVLGGIVWLQLFERARAAPWPGEALDMDALSFSVVLWNFSAVGVLTVFFWPLPLLLKQSYLVYIAAITAFWFTKIPAWSTWTMLVMMALYDIVAVLTPGGPLKMLVDIASERQEELPALVYEANPDGDSAAVFEQALGGRDDDEVPVVLRAAPKKMRRGAGSRRGGPSEDSRERTERNGELDVELGSRAGASGDLVQRQQQAQRPPPQQQAAVDAAIARQGVGSTVQYTDSGSDGAVDDHHERALMSDTTRPGCRAGGDTAMPSASGCGPAAEESEDGWEIPGGSVKLGLGDFIFYSVLVGRAAMYDSLTMFCSYFAIVAGLGITFLLLALHQRALPALPFSIALGVAFYFLARAFMEQMVVGLAVAGAAV